MELSNNKNVINNHQLLRHVNNKRGKYRSAIVENRSN